MSLGRLGRNRAGRRRSRRSRLTDLGSGFSHWAYRCRNGDRRGDDPSGVCWAIGYGGRAACHRDFARGVDRRRGPWRRRAGASTVGKG